MLSYKLIVQKIKIFFCQNNVIFVKNVLFFFSIICLLSNIWILRRLKPKPSHIKIFCREVKEVMQSIIDLAVLSFHFSKYQAQKDCFGFGKTSLKIEY